MLSGKTSHIVVVKVRAGMAVGVWSKTVLWLTHKENHKLSSYTIEEHYRNIKPANRVTLT